MADLEESKIDFGKQQLGKKYRQVWGGGTTLGEVVRPALRDIHEDGASKVHPLRQPEGGTSREQWPDGASDPSHGSSQECAEERDHDQGQSQEPDTSTVTRTPMPVGRCGRPQCLHSDRGQHREPGERASGGRHVPCQPTGDPSDADRERSGPSDELSGAEPCSSAARTALRGSECPSVQASRDAGDPSADCMISEDMSPETNREKQMFHRLVNQYTEELDIIIQQHVHQGKFSQRIDVMEIFCGEHSQLTHQCNQLGFKAERFGYAQGDLQTSVGRQSLFQRLAQCRPRHVWVSPSCGPWEWVLHSKRKPFHCSLGRTAGTTSPTPEPGSPLCCDFPDFKGVRGTIFTGNNHGDPSCLSFHIYKRSSITYWQQTWTYALRETCAIPQTANTFERL